MAIQKHSVTFRDIKVEYDANELKQWKTQKALATPEDSPAGFFAAFDRVLLGKSDEVAEKIGGTLDDMGALLTLISTVVGGEVKN